MEVWRISWKDNDATRRISVHLIAVEVVAKPDVEDAGDDRVDAVFRMPMRHQLHPCRHFDPDNVGAGL